MCKSSGSEFTELLNLQNEDFDEIRDFSTLQTFNHQSLVTNEGEVVGVICSANKGSSEKKSLSYES